MATEVGLTLKTVERAFEVLEIIAASEVALTTKEVAEKLKHNLSSTYHIVKTLQHRNYLDKNDRGELFIGRQIGVLNSGLGRGVSFTDLVNPYVNKLASSCSETIYLTRWINNLAVIQIVIESKQSLRVTGLDIGYSGSEERRASGKAILSQLAPAQVIELSSQMFKSESKERRKIKLKNLEKELEEVRAKGFAFDKEEYEPGVCCIAMPYFMANGEVGGSVAVSAPVTRVQTLLKEVRLELKTISAEITNALKYMPL